MKKCLIFPTILGMFILLCISAVADTNPFSVSGYGIIHYANFDWELDPNRRAAIDVERFVVAPKYRINDTIRLEAEIEFEHGGTGSTMEFDKFEEFGEFEMEIEKGGEIIVEKLAAVFSVQPALNFRVGHIIVPVGLVSKRHRPQHYFTTTRPEAEAQCASCHIPTLRTGVLAGVPSVSNQTIHPYTDLLLHDMGPGLADNRPDFHASGTEWRTPPLWGIGLVRTVNGHTNFLHDGRARNLMEAILWHGGEAERSRQTVLEMSKTERDALIAFLESL